MVRSEDTAIIFVKHRRSFPRSGVILTPGIDGHHGPVMEVNGEHEGIVKGQIYDSLRLGLSALFELLFSFAQIFLILSWVNIHQLSRYQEENINCVK